MVFVTFELTVAFFKLSSVVFCAASDLSVAKTPVVGGVELDTFEGIVFLSELVKDVDLSYTVPGKGEI